MFENPRRDRQARNFTVNVSKILDLKSSSQQIFFRKLSLGAPCFRSILWIRVSMMELRMDHWYVSRKLPTYPSPISQHFWQPVTHSDGLVVPPIVIASHSENLNAFNPQCMWLIEGAMSDQKWTYCILGKRFCPNVWANRLCTRKCTKHWDTFGGFMVY